MKKFTTEEVCKEMAACLNLAISKKYFPEMFTKEEFAKILKKTGINYSATVFPSLREGNMLKVSSYGKQKMYSFSVTTPVYYSCFLGRVKKAKQAVADYYAGRVLSETSRQVKNAIDFLKDDYYIIPKASAEEAAMEILKNLGYVIYKKM